MRTQLLGVIGAAGLALSGLAHAEEGEGLGFSEVQTQRVAETYRDRSKACAALPVVYRVDCMQQVFDHTARVISKASAYWEAEVALTRVNRNLYSFVRANTDKSVGRERANGAKVKAVTQASLPQARTLYEGSLQQAIGLMSGGTKNEIRYFKPITDELSASMDMLK